MRALILAAGLGTRFRPETLETPKPLLPLHGKPILFRLIEELERQGVEHFVINLHHLGVRLREAVERRYPSTVITFSAEDPILGTAGAILRAAEAGLLPDERFLVVNGDLFSTLPLARLSISLEAGSALSALGVVPNSHPEVETPLWGDSHGRLVGVGRRPGSGVTGPWLFTGLQAARSELLGRIPVGISELARDLLVPSVERRDGAFSLVPYRVPEEGFWFDLGTRERLSSAEEALKPLLGFFGSTP